MQGGIFYLQHWAGLGNARKAISGQHLPLGTQSRFRQRKRTITNALAPEHLEALSGSISHLLTLGYEAVVLPCSAQNCGDQVYRSSLDPVLRMEEKGINPQGIALLAVALTYLLIKPGVLPGAIDYYITQPLQRLKAKAYGKMDFAIGKKLASGGFGTVYLADMVDPETKQSRKVIVKKATEFGEAEVWMNERMMRAAPKAAAEFITGFSDGDGKAGDPLWLVWAYEGDSTLAQLMQKDFPANLEPLLFGRELNIPSGPGRKAAVIRVVTQQLLECLQACHAAGIVHRDVKPQNLIMSEESGRVKLIDFGAAADLRIGINYQPNMYLLDMRYAPPQQYIMSKYTPRAPTKPLAALLSPVLWNLFGPDRFDMYSVGITIMQMAFPNLRNDNALIAFNKQLSEQYNYDLRRWRAAVEKKGGREWAEGFAVLDCDDGAGWDLCCSLVQYNPNDRLSSAAALTHRWLAPTRIDLVATEVAASMTTSFMGRFGGLETMGKLADVRRMADQEAGWLEQKLSPSATPKVGGFTETQLEEVLKEEKKKSKEEPPSTYPSATMAWWEGRNSQLQAKLSQRKGSGGGQSGARNGNSSGDGNENGNGKAPAKKSPQGGRKISLKNLIGAKR